MWGQKVWEECLEVALKNKIIEIRYKINLKNVALMITKVLVTFYSYYQRAFTIPATSLK